MRRLLRVFITLEHTPPITRTAFVGVITFFRTLFPAKISQGENGPE